MLCFPLDDVMRLSFLKNLIRTHQSSLTTKNIRLLSNSFRSVARKYSTMENSNENTEQTLNNMSVKELKALLSSRNVDHHAIEKSDLIELAKKSLAEVCSNFVSSPVLITDVLKSRGNELWKEKSPYLLQHKGNPVHWMAYGPRAFEIAKKEDKPILISIGYGNSNS